MLVADGFWNFLLLAAAGTSDAAPANPFAPVMAILGLVWTISKVGIGLGFVIFVHELGHFLVAKACGVQCDKFYIGFDVPIKIGPIHLPAKLFHFTYGETEYGVGIIPLGGYVKMLGQDDDPRNAQAEAERTMVKKEKPSSEEGETIESISNAVAESAMNPVAHEGDYELDPRSFPAKSVPARMAIISAGVIMNLIFAVIFGAVAFLMGVPYAPAIVGDTVNGSPAWIAGMQPGDKLIQVGVNGHRGEHLRFADELVKPVMFNGADSPIHFVVRHPDGSEEAFDIQPVMKERDGGRKAPSIGITPTESLKVGVLEGQGSHLNATTSVPLKTTDLVTHVNGEPISRFTELLAIFAQNPDKPLQLTLHRETKEETDDGKTKIVTETIQTEVSPKPLKNIGLAMQPGAIVAVRRGTPADKAGIKAGDRILKIDGEELGDPLTLDQRLLSKAGQEMTLTIEPASKPKQTQEITLTATIPQDYDGLTSYILSEPVGLHSLGIALAVTNEVATVQPGSMAEVAGLQPGDKIIEARTFNPDEKIDALEKKNFEELKTKFVFDNQTHNWNRFFGILQFVHKDTVIILSFKRGDDIATVGLKPTTYAGYYEPSHGLNFLNEIDTRKAANIGEALALGFRETKERMGEVLVTLSSLGRGRISLGDLGGPLTIFTVAGIQANVGVSSLLMFLVLLSANLAIINFLPIPALDGGHMVFLIAEALRGKPVDPELQMKLTVGGVLGLLTLMAFVTVMDVGKLIKFFS